MSESTAWYDEPDPVKKSMSSQSTGAEASAKALEAGLPSDLQAENFDDLFDDSSGEAVS